MWKLIQRLKGFKVGTIVKIWSEDKQKYIKCCVTSIEGDSITRKYFEFYLGINLFEPLQGNDSRFYGWGSYSPKEFKYNPVEKVFYQIVK